MTFSEFLANKRKQNPKIFAANKITITIESLIAQLEAAYNAGYGNLNREQRDSTKPGFDFLSDLFKGKK